MILIIQPKYESLRTWFESLPSIFTSIGEMMYDARNQIKRMTLPTGEMVCVKKFHRPILFNAFIYGSLRPSKAKRSYEYGLYLCAHQIATPEPIAYIEERHHGQLMDSYLITKVSKLTRLYRDWTLNYSPELELTIPAFAQFTAHMHNEGVLHLDYSPGNILWDKINGQYQFEIIDINRMRIGKSVSIRASAKSLRRLCAPTCFFRHFAAEYAPLRGFNVDEFTKLVLFYRDLFWNNGRKANYQYE